MPSVNGRLTCCVCGADLGEDDDYRDPDCMQCLEREVREEDERDRQRVVAENPPPRRESPYAARIRAVLADYERTTDPRHVEAFMRLGHGTLDHLPAFHFGLEVIMCANMVDNWAGAEQSEKLAVSYGL